MPDQDKKALGVR